MYKGKKMIYTEKALNIIIFNDDDFDPKHNYIPDIKEAMTELNPKNEMHFVVDINRIPAVLVLYLRALIIQIPDLNLILYLRDPSDFLKESLDKFQLKYKNIDQFPWSLPTRENDSR